MTLLLGLGIATVAILGIMLLAFLTQSAIGILILAVLPLLLICGPLSVAYIILVVTYTIRQFRNKFHVRKRHLIAATGFLVVGLIPNIGPIYLGASIILNPFIERYSEYRTLTDFKGPTDQQIASANIQDFSVAQILFDGCNVSHIWTAKFDKSGPYTRENGYAIVSTRNNGTIAYEEAPPSVNLSLDDTDKIEEAIRNYGQGIYPGCDEEVEWSNKYRFK